MKSAIKDKINSRLKRFVETAIDSRGLGKINPLISRSIKEFVLRDGKRIRPIFFLLAYQTYAKKKALPESIIRTSLAFELLHDFLLVHDDIIDNSKTRRGKPAMHKVLQRSLKQSESTGKNMSIVIGDIIYAMAIEAFMSTKAHQLIALEALRVFLSSTILTGAGEFIDVLNGFTQLKGIRLRNIRLNYLLKTAEYTFKSPLVCGCIFAGAPNSEIAKVSRLGELLGEAFQIQDDLLGLFGRSQNIGKSVLSDMIEAKKTLPIFLAFKLGSAKDRTFINKCLGNKYLKLRDLEKIKRIVIDTGALKTTENEVNKLIKKSRKIILSLKLKKAQKKLFEDYMLSFIKN
ncbi:MAG: polyprenyl synthetase family protein [Candidatus Omnitrophica bacterium]|nr:polyprenyl synthetase family protein [Candidatus Omnitrophota bacterium]